MSIFEPEENSLFDSYDKYLKPDESEDNAMDDSITEDDHNEEFEGVEWEDSEDENGDSAE